MVFWGAALREGPQCPLGHWGEGSGDDPQRNPCAENILGSGPPVGVQEQREGGRSREVAPGQLHSPLTVGFLEQQFPGFPEGLCLLFHLEAAAEEGFGGQSTGSGRRGADSRVLDPWDPWDPWR